MGMSHVDGIEGIGLSREHPPRRIDRICFSGETALDSALCVGAIDRTQRDPVYKIRRREVYEIS